MPSGVDTERGTGGLPLDQLCVSENLLIQMENLPFKTLACIGRDEVQQLPFSEQCPPKSSPPSPNSGCTQRGLTKTQLELQPQILASLLGVRSLLRLRRQTAEDGLAIVARVLYSMFCFSSLRRMLFQYDSVREVTLQFRQQ